MEWRDIDLDSGLVSVRRAAYQSKALGHYTDTPKSKRSLRTLKLPLEVLSLLTRYRDHQSAYAATLGDKWHDTGRVFTAWDGSYMCRRGSTKRSALNMAYGRSLSIVSDT